MNFHPLVISGTATPSWRAQINKGKTAERDVTGCDERKGWFDVRLQLQYFHLETTVGKVGPLPEPILPQRLSGGPRFNSYASLLQ